MTKTVRIILFCVLILICIGCFIAINRSKGTNPIPVVQKVDSLTRITDSLVIERQPIIYKIDSIKTNINNINEWYEKKYNIVLTQPTDSDALFFSNYLSESSQRFFSSNYADSIKSN